MVYDAHDLYPLLFGGSYLNSSCLCTQYYNDTWALENGTWTNLTASVAPSPREGFGLAYDALDGYVVLFGGHPFRGPPALNDTWKFSGGVWTNITVSHSPPPRFWGSMAYSTSDAAILLFGGNSITLQYLGDTWEFAAGLWSEITPSTSPSARDASAFIFNGAENILELFGGQNSTGVLNDSWVYSAGSWSSRFPTNPPDPRLGAGYAYDAAAGVAVLFGGFPAAYTPYGTWIYANGSWTDFNNLPNVPSSNFDTVWGQMAYDPTSQQVILVPASTPVTFALNVTVSTGPAPLTVSASVSPLAGIAPLAVDLRATPSGGTPPYRYAWITGIGGELNSANDSIVYPSAGDYSVKLWVNDSGTGTYSSAWTVIVSAAPLQASATSNPNPSTVAQTVSFTSTVSGGTAPYSYSWTFGDGSTATTAAPTHDYLSAEVFPVAFEVQDASLASIFVNFSQTVGPVPLTLTTSVTPRVGVAPLPVAFSSVASGGTAPYTYAWGFGYQGASSLAENASFTYSNPGTYSANVTATDHAGATISAGWTIVVELAALTVAASASTTDPSPDQNVSFVATPSGGSTPYTYSWSFGDQGSSTLQDPIHGFARTGSYTVTVTVHDVAGGSATANLTITVGSSGTTASALPASGWEIVGLLVIVVAIIVLFVVWRRRKKERPPPSNTEGSPPTSGST